MLFFERHWENSKPGYAVHFTSKGGSILIGKIVGKVFFPEPTLKGIPFIMLDRIHSFIKHKMTKSTQDYSI